MPHTLFRRIRYPRLTGSTRRHSQSRSSTASYVNVDYGSGNPEGSDLAVCGQHKPYQVGSGILTEPDGASTSVNFYGTVCKGCFGKDGCCSCGSVDHGSGRVGTGEDIRDEVEMASWRINRSTQTSGTQVRQRWRMVGQHQTGLTLAAVSLHAFHGLRQLSSVSDRRMWKSRVLSCADTAFFKR